MKTATQARKYYIKKARRNIKRAISASIKHSNECYTTFTFSEESFKLAVGHVFWLTSMGYHCVIDKDKLTMRVSWL